MFPSAYPEVESRPALRELLRVQVDMQVADLQTLLCLPHGEAGLEAGCNLTATTLAANLIAGASVLFWNSSVDALERRGDRAERFTGLMTAHYPWCEQDAANGELGAQLVWDHTRNPLSHTLGVGKQVQLFPGMPSEERGVWLAKPVHGLPPEVAEQLMESYERPEWIEPTVTSDSRSYTIHVDSLAWGVTRMLRDLFADTQQADAAEETAEALLRPA